ncbi:hypothetical protein [Bombilactobacillus apium]|uniref:hypothetical protein n=1 Tax=Bombilactobacillus apium TaxID=2675299 RepID=UPI002B4AC745|nr:hypothetical protein [Bombilactobacillus apium]
MDQQFSDLDLADPHFEQTMFLLDVAPQKNNITRFAFQENLLPEAMDDLAWALPAYLSADFNLFLIFAPILPDQWTITCSQVTIAPGQRITAMSNVVPIGRG